MFLTLKSIPFCHEAIQIVTEAIVLTIVTELISLMPFKTGNES